MAEATIRTRLDLARKELLELGLRNTLLNYRLTKARGVGVSEVSATDVFRWLVSEGTTLSFIPVAAIQNWNERKNPPPALPTSHDEKSLQARLLSTYYAARTHIEERGVNILFMAVGMLHWYEDESSERELKAPLLLIPVQLNRTSAAEKFTVQYDEEDVEDNLSLAAKLKAEFRINLPTLPDIEELDVGRYFAAIERRVSGQKRWHVERDEIALGFFSFSKFLMYRDLEPENWCGADDPDGSPLLAAILRDGFAADPAIIPEDTYLDKLIAPNVLSQVMDADSSQALAMLDVRDGRNLVIQGPPGTGKSQTITNLIADAVGQGKRVLFVAEKMTALEVVKRRLDQVHLGDACLELHSHSANKKAVLADLKNTLWLGRPTVKSLRWTLDHYKRVRDELNEYCLAINTPIAMSGWTPRRIMGELLAIDRVRGATTFPAVSLDEAVLAEVRAWDRNKLEAKQQIVQKLQAHLAGMGVPSSHPFRDSRVKAVLPSDREAIAKAAKHAVAAQYTLDRCVRELSSFMGIAARADRADADVLARAARRALSAPHLSGMDLRTGEWGTRRDEIRQVLDSGECYSGIHAQYDSILIPEAWHQNLLGTRQILNTTGRKWWRWLSSDYRSTRKHVAGLCRGEHSRDAMVQMDLVDRIMEAARLKDAIAEHEPLVARLFGVQWQGLRSDWKVLRRLTEWVVDLYRDLGDGRIPPGIIDFLSGTPSLESLKGKVDALESALPVFDRALSILFDHLAIEPEAQQKIRSVELPEQISLFQTMLDRLDDVQEIVGLNNLTVVLEREGLAWVTDIAWSWAEASHQLVPLFRATCLEPVLRLAYDERNALRTANGSAHTGVCEMFCGLDSMSLKVTQLDLAVKHHAGLPKLNGLGQLGLLSREFQKRSRHLPIRKLVAQAGNAIQAIKPVFMMSPMSIAAFIPSKTIKFDLVVFDEASQVKPVDAFGAILRGAQLVVVGDSKQLPPTSFFDSLLSGDDLEDRDDEENVSADIESILGLAAARGMQQRMLRWHYRSRHHSLIALSNSEFYENRLIVFPSPDPAGRGLGLVFHHLPKTSYDRGKSRTNQKEAEVVARAVMVHAKSTPDLTLGVAAFSITQADAILNQLETMRRADPSAETFFSGHKHEPFFVKNLESVQGDERDVIFISVGYGRTEQGYLGMNFGALNGQGGERRLNVLITRARSCCEVFSNITHDDLDLNRSAARGIAALKAFLKYAQTGIADVPDAGEEEGDSPFEHEVAQALRAMNLDVATQVGSGGFRIDLAVRDSEKPGRYVLGIECDGATYHSSRSARDRDRLRQQVLVNLGWRIHRIWSTDWFQNPRRELQRVIAAIEQARVSPDRTRSKQGLVTDPIVATALPRTPTTADPEPQELRADPYQIASIKVRLDGQELHEVSTAELVGWVQDIVETESPVHVDEVARRIADAAGVQRVGSRIGATFERAIGAAARGPTIRKRGSFLWIRDMQTPPIRDRSELAPASRKMALLNFKWVEGHED